MVERNNLHERHQFTSTLKSAVRSTAKVAAGIVDSALLITADTLTVAADVVYMPEIYTRVTHNLLDITINNSEAVALVWLNIGSLILTYYGGGRAKELIRDGAHELIHLLR